MIRVVTLNIWQEQGPWQDRLRLIQKRLAEIDPDVVCLQEVRHVEGRIPNQAETLAHGLGMAWTYEVAQQWGGGEEGLAILSKRPPTVRDFCELPYTSGRSRRICLGAQLEAEDQPFWVFTTHLAWRMTDGVLREQQVVAVDEFVRSRSAQGIVSILTGDFNAAPDTDEMRFLRGLTSLDGKRAYYQDAFVTCNPKASGHTWVSSNPYTRLMEWLERDRRLDYIYVTPRTRSGTGWVASSRLVCTEPDTRGIWCSDHFGVMAEVVVRQAAR